MNPKEEIEKVKFISNGTEFDKGLELISKDKSIEIAEKYAEEMCKEQKGICIKVAWNKSYKKGASSINALRPKTPMQVREDLINAPLATEIDNKNN